MGASLMSRVKNNKRPRTVSLAKWITHTSYRRESVFLSSKEYKIPTTADKHRWPTQFLKHSEKIPSDRTFNIKCLVFWEIFQNTKACIVFVKVKGWEDGEGCQVVLSNFRRVNKKYCNQCKNIENLVKNIVNIVEDGGEGESCQVVLSNVR